MKKFTLFIALALALGSVKAGVVDPSSAQTVATNFYKQNYTLPSVSLSLFYTEKAANGNPVFYVFNVNQHDGFVIVSAEDAALPIIGYSNKGSFVIPAHGTNIDYWMQDRKSAIAGIRAANLKADAEINDQWTSYINNTKPKSSNQTHRDQGIFPSNSQYLVQSTWDQPSPYNAMCPGGSVTGCVATAMSQIMRYWQYPAHGIYHSAYYCSPPMYPNNYGLLSANYDSSNYVWSAMPLNVVGANNEVAKLCYDAGVSVAMSYDPAGSGSYVLTADAVAAQIPDSASAQRSYPKFFGFNSATLQGLLQSSYSLSAWQNLMETELNNNRPIQYVGTDPVNGGHTWVCDGYDATPNFHMNWGWSGSDDGWYSLSNLNPGPFNFSQNHEALIGIEPPNIKAEFTATPLNSCSAPLTVQFKDRSLVPALANPVTSWQWTFTGGTPATSSVQNPSVVYNSPGTYSVTLKVTNNLGNSTITQTNYIVVSSPNLPPLVQGFESGFPPAQWYVVDNQNLLTKWQLGTPGGRGASAHSITFDNCANGMLGEYDQIYTPVYDFTSIPAPKLYFDVAYAPYDVAPNPPESDTLAVYYTLNCGATWTRVYLKGGMTLCTAGKSVANGANHNVNGCFVPLNSNWRTDTIKIPAIAGKSNVMFSFENRSGNGSTMYLDNINIPGVPLGVYTPTNDKSFNVYPNPSNGNFQVSFNAQQDKTYDLAIYNMLGQQVMHIVIQNNSGAYVYPVNLSNFGKGLYSVILRDGEQQTVKKIAVF